MMHASSSSQPALTLGVENGACQDFGNDSEEETWQAGPTAPCIDCLGESFYSAQPQFSLS